MKRPSFQKLPGVKAIGWVDCSMLLPHVALRAICGMPVAISTDVHPIQFFDEPVCTCKSKKENVRYVDTATLQFVTSDLLPYGLPLGFVVTDIHGNSFLIGSKEHPLPVVESELRLGKPDGDAAVCAYEVTHVAYRSLIPCVIADKT